ncbi:MAG: helix-turn-helix transcriptional regulator [Candidatus Lokiarchaeota archaeon]|nr:helix-turn-helix transcriptional regulator [Candidatus Lokiarchaeota archaeon]
MKPDLYSSLGAFSNKTRMEIVRLLFQIGNPVGFTKLMEGIGCDPANSSNLANHLKKLVELGLVEKDSSTYALTKLGLQLYDQIDGIEKTIEEHNKDILVRTSDFCFESFDERKITENLIREADFSEEEAFSLAKIAKRKLLTAEITYLTAPLIREYMNVILLEEGKEEARHKLTRLGLPPFDVKQLLHQGNFETSIMLYNELGKHIMEQFLLLNLLPQRFADFYLSGKLFFLHPESWGLIPLEVVIPGEKFTKIIIEMCEEYDPDDPEEQPSLNQFLPLVINNFFEYLRNFFSGGAVITEFEYVLRELHFHFKKSQAAILDLLFEMIPSLKIQYSHDKRTNHSKIWELWIEIDLNNLDTYSDEIECIINKYHEDIRKCSPDFSSGLIYKPNLIMNFSPQCKTIILDAKQFTDLPEIYQKILEISQSHNITIISPPALKSQKFKKMIITPHLNPIYIDNTSESILVLDKIYVNLPKIIQISENPPTSHSSRVACAFTTKSSFSLDKTKEDIERDINKFTETLKEWICHAINLFDEKMALISKNIGKFKLWNSVSKKVFNRDLFQKPTDLIDYDGHIPIFCGICLNGLTETVQYFTGFSADKHSESFAFLTKILSTVSNLLKSNSQPNGVSYVLSQAHLDNYLHVRFHQDSSLIHYLMQNKISLENDQENQNKDKSVYAHSVFNNHTVYNLKKLAHNFKIYQKDMDLAYLNIDITHPLETSHLLGSFKTILRNRIHSFGFSRIINYQHSSLYRYAGSYKPLSYYHSPIQELIRQKPTK